jgi:hypothetical protein
MRQASGVLTAGAFSFILWKMIDMERKEGKTGGKSGEENCVSRAVCGVASFLSMGRGQ